ncbi:MAG: hypothetical protein RMI79_00650 [Nitrososphaerota archaeon]|nr:hypothetical protein [Nitrososphaerota archaeon]
MSEKDEEIINSLKKELEEVRRKKESAIGPEVYNYYWEKEMKLEELISTLIEHQRIAREAKARKPIPKIDIEEIRRWLFEDIEKSREDETIKRILKRKEIR